MTVHVTWSQMLWNSTVYEEHTTELTKAILFTVISAAKILQSNRALLLPHAVAIFQDYPAQGGEDYDTLLELGDSTIKFSARWLLNQLITYLQPYMSYKCVFKRIGTLLYPCDGDLIKCLSLALYQSSPRDLSKSFECADISQPRDVTSVLNEAGSVINDIIHNEVRKHKKTPIDLTAFNFENSIDGIDPLLWKFVCLCTRSVRARAGKTHCDDAYTKKIRRYFTMQVMFTTTLLVVQCFIT